MGLFDIFKSKGQSETDAMLGKVLAQTFPNGEADIVRDVDRVRRLTKNKIPAEKMRGYVQGCKVLLVISQNHTEPSFIQSFRARSDNRITDAEAKDVYAYLAGEAMYMDNLNRLMPDAGNPADIQRMFSGGTYNDVIDGARGPFGVSVNNPIPTICVRSSKEYLSRLRYQGQPVQSERQGSTSSPVTLGNVDIYNLTAAGRSLGKVYLCPYHKNTSKLAPDGFTLA